ncbi:rhomboid family serine protease (plasmid) [Sinorhizobium sojae CCBAU 05684]|uniref:Rhomboid family serine protease n=1 Tax=Sinorhizobium sojae CCBAU 05684 TaxID=716928 RepID=A0A249PLL5_9HYPH|nr:rhomboid family intramembrane serine protease [Sinorhizobium sojae]ASY66801.1 rhomboid family serine protease [Sinorhizobium sojae CCBAU 05684]
MIPIYDTAPRARHPVIVYAIIGLNFLIFLWMIGLPEPGLYWVLTRFALIPLRYSEPQLAMAAGLDPDSYWPLLTNAFLHGGWLHIILNMWSLWIFGPAIEARCGRLGFILLYLAGAVAASAAHLLANWTSPVPALGASGAIAAIIAAYAVTYPRAKVILLVPVFFLPLFIPVSALFFAAFWFLIQILQGTQDLFASSMGSGVAWWAHIGGFVLGAVFAKFAHALGLGRDIETRQWTGSVPKIPRR